MKSQKMKIGLSGLLTVCIGLGLIKAVQGQSITPANDGTGTTVNQQGNQYNIDAGTLSEDGKNLFHSLEKFGLSQGEIANFLSNPQIRNILTRIVGGNPSVINGLIQVLNGNSNLYIINPAESYLGPNAQINVPADFVVTTATKIGFDNDLWFNALESNDYAQLIGDPSQFAFDLAKSGSIINAGDLTVTAGHNLMLLGATVINSGTLSAPEGNITIAAIPGTNRIKLSQQNNLVSLEIELPQKINGQQQIITPLDLPTLLTEGEITNPASTIPIQPGTVIISGNLSVSNSETSPLQVGGQVNVIGAQIGLMQANINATGTLGGGRVRIGGDILGQNEIPTASRTFINPKSFIDASAITTGEGGQVIVSGDIYTNVLGQIQSRGGLEEGNGGLVEVTGLNALNFQGNVDTSAVQGNFGVLVLNSKNLTIENLTQLSPPRINPSSLDSLSSNITLEASNNITFNSPLDLENSPSGLTAIAENNITVNNSINTQNGSIILQANQNINVNNSNLTSQNGSIILEPTLPDSNSLNIFLENSTIETFSSTGNITLTANEIDLKGSTQLQGQNQLVLQPSKTDRNIILGGDNNSSALNLTSEELEKLNEFQSVIIGKDNGIGTIEIGSNANEVNFNEKNFNLTLQGGNITFNNSLSLANDKTLTLNTQTVTSTNLPQTTDIKIDGQQSQLILNTSGLVGTSENPLDTHLSQVSISSSSGNNFIHNHSNLILGKTSIAGNLDLIVDGDISDNDALVIGKTTTLSGQNIILDNNNDFKTIKVIKAENLTLNDTNKLEISNTQINNNLEITTVGDINNSGNLKVTGVTNINTNGNNITLDNENNDLNIVNIINGKNIVFKDINDFILNNSVTVNSLTIQAIKNITTANINISSNQVPGGNVNLISNSGTITTGTINTSSMNNAGNVILKAKGDINTTYINSQGINNSVGGQVEINTNNFLRVTDSFINSNDKLASISTIGQNGGNIVIQHGGQGITPFKVGNAAINGTADAITSGNNSIDNESLLFTTTRGNIQIISVDKPITSNPESTPIPKPNFQPIPNPNPNSNREPELNLNSNLNQEPKPKPRSNINFEPISRTNVERLPIIEEPESINQELFVNTNQPGLSLQSNNEIIELATTDFSVIPTATVNTEVRNIENEYSNSFENYLGIKKASALNLEEEQTILKNIEEKAGYKSAFIYIFFKPNTTTAQQKQEQQEILWRYLGDKKYSQESFYSETQGTDQLELIVITSTGIIKRTIEGVTQEKVMPIVEQFQKTVTNPRRPNAYIQPSQQLYQWFITSIEKDLEAQKIDTLVFILDAGLRSVPMAALNDGKQFLIEKYSIGLMPSLALTDTRYINVQNSQVLAMGASIFREQNPLPSVPTELSVITDQLWEGKSYINESFTLNNLKKAHKSNQFRILHLATHANFEAGPLSNSYIQLWDDKLTMDQLKWLGLDKPPINLLVLSACRTALGNKESELGFAGAAVLANVKTVLGSLWEVNDEGTLALMSSFYKQLKKVPIKAEALRQAQLNLLRGDVKMVEQDSKQAALLIDNQRLSLPPQLAELGSKQFTHPYYWSSFTVIGNPW